MTRINIQFTPPADSSEASDQSSVYSSNSLDKNKILVRQYPDGSKIQIIFQEYIRYSEIYTGDGDSIEDLITRSIERVGESVEQDICDYSISIIFDREMSIELSDSVIMDIEKSENEFISEYNPELLSTGEVLIDFSFPTKSLA